MFTQPIPEHSYEADPTTQTISHYAPAISCFFSRGGADHTIRINLDKVVIIISVADDSLDDAEGRVITPETGLRGYCERGSLLIGITNHFLYEQLKTIQSMPGVRNVLVPGPRFGQEPVIERLARALLSTDAEVDDLSSIYIDGISRALVTRVVKLCARQHTAPAVRSPCALAKWRLRRVVEFVEAHLGETIGLADLASAAGLSRMHFAAQFRAATGVRPHDYVLRRRIEHAREMLRSTPQPIVEVALTVGFQTQAHFTTVFRRLVGDTPERWRRANASVVPPMKSTRPPRGGADGVFN